MRKYLDIRIIKLMTYSLGGPELLRKTLNKNLGINPEYYAVIDFTGFEKMIDELEPNGVPMDVEKICLKILAYLLKRSSSFKR